VGNCRGTRGFTWCHAFQMIRNAVIVVGKIELIRTISYSLIPTALFVLILVVRK